MKFFFLFVSFLIFCLKTTATTLVINGKNIEITDKLSVVRVEIKPYLGEREKDWIEKINDHISAWTCTATLVSKRVLLTAKHCLKTYPLQIQAPANSNHMRFDVFIGGKINRAVKVIGVHQNPDKLFYNKQEEASTNIRLRFLGGDFAALILSEDSAKHITDAMISPINLCSAKNKDPVHVIGFGYTNKWNEILAQVTTLRYYKRMGEGKLRKDSDFYFLSQNDNGDMRTAEGDSGAPLFNKASEVIGIASSGGEEKEDFYSYFVPLNNKSNKAVIAALAKKGFLNSKKIKCL